MDQDVYALLAQANLQRIRGNWQEAVDGCMAAMRIVPGSVAAQSLLGDIHENQGRIDDAMQWYRMALDSNPDSPADKQKLARLLAMRGQTVNDIYGTTLRIGAPQQAAPRSMAATLKLAAALLGLTMLGIVVMAVLQSRAQLDEREQAAQMQSNVAAQPILIDGGQSTASSGGVPARDQFEMSLASSLHSSLDSQLQPFMEFGDVIADPRSGRLTLTFILRPIGMVNRNVVLAQALKAAVLAAQLQQSNAYTLLTVRILLSPDDLAFTSTSGTWLFIGDITRADLAAYPLDPTGLPASQLQVAFTNQWWAPNLPN